MVKGESDYKKSVSKIRDVEASSLRREILRLPTIE